MVPFFLTNKQNFIKPDENKQKTSEHDLGNTSGHNVSTTLVQHADTVPPNQPPDRCVPGVSSMVSVNCHVHEAAFSSLLVWYKVYLPRDGSI